METNQVEKELESVDFDRAGYFKVVEIEDWAIDFGIEHDLVGSGMMLPHGEYTFPDPIFDDFLMRLHNLKKSSTPKEFHHNKEWALASWRELEEHVR